MATLAQKIERNAKDRARYRRNRETILARKRDYYAENRDRIIAAVAAYKRRSPMTTITRYESE